jgi:hypothetical protein
MPNPKGLRYTKDGGLIIHPAAALDTTEGSSIKIPQVDTALGAGFGDTIADEDRAFAASREPVAHFLTYGVAADVTDKWFHIDDPDTEEADPALDRTVQDALSQLKFKTRLTEALEQERIYGWSLIVGGFDDVQDINKLSTPLKQGSQLKQLAVYPSTKDGYKTKQAEVDRKDDDPSSPRFGEPTVYRLDRGSGSYLYVHYTRVCRVATRSDESSVLDPVWDDLNCGRNIRWGAAQWMYRNGGGFPVIEFPAGTTVDKLEEWSASGAFADLMARTYICIAQNSPTENNGMKFHFEGAQGRALDPTSFFKTNIEQVSVATGIPQPKLVGAQAGAVTGSEVNMQDYYKVISRIQSGLEDVVRWVVDKLADSGQLGLIKTGSDKDGRIKQLFSRVFGDYRHRTARTYTIEWNSAFELSSLDEARVEQLHAQANQAKLDYMQIDEVRAEENLDPLPNGEGAGLKKANLNLFGQGQKGNPDLTTNDKFLVVDLNRKGKGKDNDTGRENKIS